MRYTVVFCLFLLAVMLLVTSCANFSGGSMGASASSFSEPRHAYKIGQPYTVRGRTYVPAMDWNYDEIGIASWYSEGFHGRPTASGERYNHNDLTAAHPTLPMPTVVRVTRLDNGRSVVVRINDRGPFVEGRIIDLSKRAAELLDMKGQGLARVRVQVLETETRQLLARMGVPAEVQRMRQTASAAPPRPVDQVVTRTAQATSREVTTSTTTQSLERQTASIVGAASAASSQATEAAISSTNRVVSSAQQASQGLQTAVGQSASAKRLWVVQLGSFTNADAAKNVLNQPFITQPNRVESAVVGGRTFHRAQLGPYASRTEAEKVRDEMIQAGLAGALVVAVQ